VTYFKVSVEALMGAGHQVGAGDARGQVKGAASGGAGEGTPAAAACQELVTRLETAAGSAEQATLALAGALLEAAANYSAADASATQSVSLHKGGG
jgi:hypothetical protein